MSITSARWREGHDLSLPAWGPYTKRYMGISHIPDVQAGLRFDLSVFPGLYRRSVNLPNVLWECGYHPWEAAPDLSYYKHRHQLIWKDQLYCDIAFSQVDESASLIVCHFVNHTAQPQAVALHYLASLNFPPRQTYSNEAIRPFRVLLPDGALWVDALHYESIRYAKADPRANLWPDGQRRGEMRDHGFVDGTALGEGFGKNAGDAVTYRFELPRAVLQPRLTLRYRMQGSVQFALSGAADDGLLLHGQGDFAVHQLDLPPLLRGSTSLTFTSQGGAEVQLDGFALAEKGAEIRFEPVVWNPTPEWIKGPRDNTLILKFEQAAPWYGLAWQVEPFEVRTFITDDLDRWMRHMVHDHVHKLLRDPACGPYPTNYTNVYQRPIFLEPQTEHLVYGLVCAGDEDQVRAQLAAFDPAAVGQRPPSRPVDLTPTPSGEAYRFSQERMAATLLTNVVYPVRTRGTWIRHATPGRWWDCLYTWDSGVIGLGLLELDTVRAMETLNAYVTEPGDRDAAFIHHGSPVPTQFYVFLEAWNRTQSHRILTSFYPRLRQYHHFLAGRLGSSTTRTPGSNLLRTWDYFYNSGGWDDYPPQVYVHQNALEDEVTPVVNTAHAIRTAQILRMAALALGEDTAEYDTDIATFARALHTHAWDEDSGYFGYVRHTLTGKPVDILRHSSGLNFNMGMDGASPLIAGICTPEQETALVERLMSSEHLWSTFGLSTVDQSAPYYREDGYWNGGIWMPHQWFFWKALLDLGKTYEAHRIARTALEVWRAEVEATYNCCEHFLVRSGRGAGWHHFGGLSAPVLCWYGAYFRPGRLSVGLNAWVSALQIADDHSALDALLRFFGQPHHAPALIVTLAPGGKYRVTWNGTPVEHFERYPGTLEVRLPEGVDEGELSVH